MSKINVLTYSTIRECRVLKDGFYPISLIIYFNGVKKRYRTGIVVIRDNWMKMNSPKLRDDDLKEKRSEIQNFLKKAEAAGNALEEFTFEAFETAFFRKRNLVIEEITFEQCAKDFLDEKKSILGYKTRLMYETMINSVNKFRPKIKLRNFDQEMIRKYEQFLISEGKAISTVGIYLRQVRAIFNFAIKKKFMSREKYPFEEFVVPAAQKSKRALNNEAIKALIEFKSDIPEEQKAIDFWTFSYLGNGMNFNDIAKLRFSNISGESLKYYRSKTRNTSRGDLKEINIHLLPRMKEVIQKWGIPEGSADNFIFPILNDTMQEKELHNAIAQFIKLTNKYLKRVTEEMGWKEPITTYYARHSYATRLKRAGVPIAFISEALGHGNITTTENYLSSFTDEEVKRNANLLLDL